MKEEKLTTYIIRYCRQALSEVERRELKLWLEESTEHRKTFDRLVASYKRGRRVGCWETIDEEKAWNKISRRLLNSQKKRSIGWWQYAAIILVLLGVGMAYWVLHPGEGTENKYAVQIAPGSRQAILRLSDGQEIRLNADTTCILAEKNGTWITVNGQEPVTYHAESVPGDGVVYNTIIVPRGGEYSLKLADGSRVWLNAETELTYPAVFSGQERHVLLKGEAFFDVAGDSLKPFVVESGYNRIEVLGTQFNVSAYEASSSVKTTLLKGKVKVSNGHDHLLLLPGEQAICEKDRLESRQVDAPMIASWVYGTFEFENMLLAEITDQLRRWYDVDFLYMNPALKKLTFTGAATRYRELGFMLELLEQLSDVRFVVRGKIIQVVEK